MNQHAWDRAVPLLPLLLPLPLPPQGKALHVMFVAEHDTVFVGGVQQFDSTGVGLSTDASPQLVTREAMVHALSASNCNLRGLCNQYAVCQLLLPSKPLPFGVQNITHAGAQFASEFKTAIIALLTL